MPLIWTRDTSTELCQDDFWCRKPPFFATGPSVINRVCFSSCHDRDESCRVRTLLLVNMACSRSFLSTRRTAQLSRHEYAGSVDDVARQAYSVSARNDSGARSSSINWFDPSLNSQTDIRPNSGPYGITYECLLRMPRKEVDRNLYSQCDTTCLAWLCSCDGWSIAKEAEKMSY